MLDNLAVEVGPIGLVIGQRQVSQIYCRRNLQLINNANVDLRTERTVKGPSTMESNGLKHSSAAPIGERVMLLDLDAMCLCHVRTHAVSLNVCPWISAIRVQLRSLLHRLLPYSRPKLAPIRLPQARFMRTHYIYNPEHRWQEHLLQMTRYPLGLLHHRTNRSLAILAGCHHYCGLHLAALFYISGEVRRYHSYNRSFRLRHRHIHTSYYSWPLSLTTPEL